jgi:hypothetical protein
MSWSVSIAFFGEGESEAFCDHVYEALAFAMAAEEFPP